MAGVDWLSLIFYLVPISISLFFVVTLILYLSKKKKLKESCTDEDAEKLKTLKTAFTVSGIIFAVMVGVVIVLSILFLLFMAHM